MIRLIRRIVLGILVPGVAIFGLLVTFLWATAPGPREAPEWGRGADMPDPRGEVASAVRILPGEEEGETEERLFVMGGIRGVLGSTVATVSIYDPAADAWSAGPALPEARHHPAAAVLGDVVYLTGGAPTATDWTPETNAWALDPEADAWRPVEPMPEGRMGHQAVAAGGRIYVVGGQGSSSDVLIYSPVEGWTRGAPMPEGRDHLVAVALGETVWAIGGRDDRIRSRVDVYDIRADEWRDGPALPEPMSAMAGGVLSDGAIHIVGGEDPGTFGGGVIDRHFVLRPIDDPDDLAGPEDALAPWLESTWAQASSPISVVHGAGFGVLGDGERLIIAGGARRQGALSVLGWTGITQAYPD